VCFSYSRYSVKIQPAPNEVAPFLKFFISVTKAGVVTLVEVKNFQFRVRSWMKIERNSLIQGEKMKTRIVLFTGIAASLGLVACANQQIAGNESKADRRVAQQSTIETVPGVLNLEKVCGHAPDSTVNATYGITALTADQYAVTRYTIRTPIYSCESNEGDGKGGDWGGFYDRSGDKASQLASAIKGVGKKTAPYLVPYFQRGKPRSWRAFSDLITSSAREIQDREGVNPSWAGNVLKQYKQDNMKSLGYLSSSDCSITGYNEETYEDRDFIRSLTALIDAKVGGGKLLPGECDGYRITWDGRSIVGTASSDTNRYDASVTYGNSNGANQVRASVSFSGVRKVVAPSRLVETQGSTAVVNNGGVQLTIQNAALYDMSQVPEFKKACKLSATVKISARKTTKLGSIWPSKKSAVLKTATFPLDGNSGSTSYFASGVAIEEKQHPVVEISTAFAAGCPFFNTVSVKNGTIEE
jgi:hypothetical protein